MNISTARYSTPEQIEVTYEDNSVNTFYDGSGQLYSRTADAPKDAFDDDGQLIQPSLWQQVTDWKASGGVVTPYDQYYGQTLESVKTSKFAEIWQASEIPKTSAADSMVGSGNQQGRNEKRLLDKQSKIMNKKSKGTSLTPEEDAFFDTYDALLDYNDSVDDKADSSQDEVELLSTMAEVDAYDVNAIIWPTWSGV